MIREYIAAAMRRARYELIDDTDPYYGEIPLREAKPTVELECLNQYST
ncbi:MAG TPA: hypothetical protein VML55_17815 [Planctomycetaceae bacterium]|nr:hypothetical protein [Planctomycetaceae bacterium]